MFRAIRNISITSRLSFVFAFATLIPIGVIVLLGTFYLSSFTLRDRAVATSFAAQNQATTMQIQVQRMNALLRAHFYEVVANQGNQGRDIGSEASARQTADEINALVLEFDQNLTNYQRDYVLATSDNMSNVRSILQSDDTNPTDPDRADLLIRDQQDAIQAVFQSQWNTYKDSQETVLNKLAAPRFDFQDAYQALYTANRDCLTLRNSWQTVVDKATTMGTKVTAVGPSLRNPLLIGTGAAILFLLFVVASAAWLVTRTITTPLRKLVALTKRISADDMEQRATVDSQDEIGQVAQSMNSMLDHIVQQTQEAQTRHSVLQTQLERLVNEVSGLGEGDLSIQAEVTTDELGVLADSFNFMAEELNNLVVNVKTLSREVQESTSEAFDHMVQLVESADDQIGQIATATVEVGNTAQSSQIVAQRAQQLYKVATETRQNAAEGRTAVQRTVAGIERISSNVHATAEKVQSLETRSREINSIVNVISGIAHQTNRLALDAAIQAAMAGENGKGFGAVAADIRRLAEQSKEQTTAINKIVRGFLEDIGSATQAIHDTENETTTGAQLARLSGTTLDTMFEVVEQQAGEIEEINRVAVRQLQSSNTVVRIMQQVSTSTQESSNNTHQAAQNMDHLARLAGKLLSSVEVFKLREDNILGATIIDEQVTPQQDSVNLPTSDAFYPELPSASQNFSTSDSRNGPVSQPILSNFSLGGLPEEQPAYYDSSTFSEQLPFATATSFPYPSNQYSPLPPLPAQHENSYQMVQKSSANSWQSSTQKEYDGSRNVYDTLPTNTERQ